MKKLLILMLVLGMASVASALPVISGPTTINVTGGSTITLTLSGTAAEASTDGVNGSGGFAGWVWVDYSLYSWQLGNVSTGTTAMGGMAAFDLTKYMTSKGGGFKFTGAPNIPWAEPTDVDIGAWFTFDLGLDSTPTTGETYTIQILDTSFNIIGGTDHAVTVVPEPMTVALLGLGGLFLLRRRKK